MSTTKWILYVAYDAVNDSVYVGQTSSSLSTRISKHKYESAHGGKGTKMHVHLRRFGVDAFTWNEVCSFTNKPNAVEAERALTLGFIDAWGEGCVLNEYAGYWSINGDGKRFHGKRHSDNTRQLLSAKRLGLTMSAESKAKMSMAKTGTRQSQETIEKRSASMSGELNHRYDPTVWMFVHDEHGRVRCTKNELRKAYNLNSGNMSELFSGKRSSVNGWRLVK